VLRVVKKHWENGKIKIVRMGFYLKSFAGPVQEDEGAFGGKGEQTGHGTIVIREKQTQVQNNHTGTRNENFINRD